MMNHQSGKHTVSLEELLRLKRAERPNADFWVEFDRELRAKQLAALVEKRPWWKSLPRTLRGLARYRLPLGATAVLAITLVSIRDNPSIGSSGNVTLSRFDAAAPESSPAPAGQESVVAANVQDSVASTTSEEALPVASTMRAEASPSAESARLVPTLATRFSDEDRPSARSIAENRAVAEALLGTTTSGFEMRALPVRAPQEPLAQMSNPSDSRRSRFATAFAAAAVGTSPVPTARVARRLSDEQLYDTIHRFGASGNTVSFKF